MKDQNCREKNVVKKHRKIYMVICRILICLMAGEGIVLWLNDRYDEPWKLFCYDVKFGFTDNPEYVKKFLLIFACFFLIYLFYMICNKEGLSFEWSITIGRRKKRYAVCWDYQVMLFILCLSFLGFNGIMGQGVEYMAKYNLWPGSSIVGHSFGGIEGNHYTGSKEAFLENYNKGYRTFEVDLEITSDDKVVLRHDWDQHIQEGISSENIPTEAEFLEVPIMGIYTPLSFADLCLLMQEYPDIWIVTDSKYGDRETVEKQFKIMIQTAEECGAVEVLDRIIIQIYNVEMHEVLQELYPFRSYIFTLYQYDWDGSAEQFAQICRWCVKHDVDAITMWDYLSDEENREIAKRYGRDIYLHTINDGSTAREFLEEGVRGIYTDDIYPEELEGKE